MASLPGRFGFMGWWKWGSWRGHQTPARISAPACTGGFEPRTEDGCFHVHGVWTVEILIEMRLGESGVTRGIVCGIVDAGRWCHPAHRTQGTEARAPCVTRLQQPRVRGRPVYGLFRVHDIEVAKIGIPYEGRWRCISCFQATSSVRIKTQRRPAWLNQSRRLGDLAWENMAFIN